MASDLISPTLSFDKPFKIILDWNDWKAKQKPGI